MKIETQEVNFQPVVITLESQAELDVLYVVLGEISADTIKVATDSGLSHDRLFAASNKIYQMYLNINSKFYNTKDED